MMRMAENHNDPAAFPPLEDTLAPAPGLLVADHFIRGGEYETYRSKGTRDWLITFTLDGEGTYLLDGNAYPCTKGDLIILLPGTTHHYHTKKRHNVGFYVGAFCSSAWMEPVPAVARAHKKVCFM